jgi:dTDP-4-amino-4,6-dideoxygalactose transaminase
VSVPLFAIRPVLEPLLEEVAARQRDVLLSGNYILGPEVEAFESEFAAYLGARHCVGVANGTDALTIALRALGVGPGDEVVLPALTFYATAEAVVNAGATPVLCDVDAATFNMTAATAEPAIRGRTKALLPVHLYGNPAPMSELRELAAAHGLRVLEDAAQAAGAKLDGRMAGALGDAASFSYFPGCFASMAPRTRRCTPRSATTPASTSCRRRGCGSCCPTWRRGPGHGDGSPRPTRPTGSGTRPSCR